MQAGASVLLPSVRVGGELGGGGKRIEGLSKRLCKLIRFTLEL